MGRGRINVRGNVRVNGALASPKEVAAVSGYVMQVKSISEEGIKFYHGWIVCKATVDPPTPLTLILDRMMSSPEL